MLSDFILAVLFYQKEGTGSTWKMDVTNQDFGEEDSLFLP